MSNFKDSKDIGDALEEPVLKYIKRLYPKAYIKEEYFKYWDIYIPEVNVSIECKFDKGINKHNNFFLEIQSNDKPSGLSVTKSDFMVFYDGEKPYWFLTSDVRRCIYSNDIKPRLNYPQEDKVAKLAYLMPKSLLLPYKIENQTKFEEQLAIVAEHNKNIFDND